MGEAQIKATLSLERPGFKLDVDLDLPGNGVSVLFGHSGSGKTTLLRCIAGLEKASRGRIQFNGDTWQDKQQFLAPHRRPLGYVFQESGLFPHLTARQNLIFAMKRASDTIPGLTFGDTVSLLGIDKVLDKHPAELSGGERQRVAIARALLIHPRLLLMDEPLSSLDQARKQEILPYLEKLKKQVTLPIIYVTHSPDEVARLADHLVALEEGRVVASGTLTETLARLDFPIKLGEETGVVLEARVTERDEQWQLAKATFPGGDFWFRDSGFALGSEVRVRIFARDVSLALEKHHDTSIVNLLPAVVEEIATDEHAGLALVKLKVGDSPLVARLTHRSAHRLQLEAGKQVWAQIKSVAIIQ